MRVLALDTSTFTASVAIVDVTGGKVLALRQQHTASLSDVLLVMIDECVREAQVMPADLEAIAVGAGPGSFTGLRIGMATAKGLAFALGRPLWLASSLQALACNAEVADDDALVIPLLDARRAEVYAGGFRRGADGLMVAVGGERVLRLADLGEVIAAANATSCTVVGDALAAYPAEIAALGPGVMAQPAAQATPSAVAVARLAAAGDRVDHVSGGAPAYVRRPEVELQYPDGVPGALARHR